MSEPGHDQCTPAASRAVVDAIEALEARVADWAEAKPRTPREVDVWVRTAEKVIQRGALIGSVTEPEA